MSTPHHVTIDTEHHYVREALPWLAVIMDATDCPAAGSPDMQVLLATASYFRHELPQHLDLEEAEVFPALREQPGMAREIAFLCQEHEEIRLYARTFHDRVAALGHHPDRLHWVALRYLVDRFKSLLFQHMDREEVTVYPSLATAGAATRARVSA